MSKQKKIDNELSGWINTIRDMGEDLNKENRQGEEVNLSAKEITINYLESIKRDTEDALRNVKEDDWARVPLICDITYLNIVINIVRESEGE